MAVKQHLALAICAKNLREVEWLEPMSSLRVIDDE
jgi:hypothetical protein